VTTICIPWRTDHGWRQTLFDWVLPIWQRTPFEISVGVDDDGGPMNVSRALNRARAQSSGDVLTVASADHIPHPEAMRAASSKALVHGWAPVFAATAALSRDATFALLAGENIDVDQSIVAEVPFCTAGLAVRTDVWDEIGGWDERFFGWGCEDTAFRVALSTLYPDPPPPAPNRSVGLWHEPASRDRFDANSALLGEYIACEGNPSAMRALIKERST
jgi:hypothetical protein